MKYEIYALGIANYRLILIKDFTTITQPLRELTHKNTKREWISKHDVAKKRSLKNCLTAEVLFYFDPNKLTKLIVNTSPVELDAVLTQKDFIHYNSNIIAYASRSLTPVEQRYSQTERKA